MTPQDFENLQKKVSQFDEELSNQMTHIAALERKVADLTKIADNLFVLCSSIQRTSDEQANAFKVITEQLQLLEP
jgi:hypothetical protein